MSYSGVEIFSIEPESVQEVLDKMDKFEDFLTENDKESFIPFLKAYRTITLRVNKSKEKFEHPADLEKLDIRFSDLYFKAMEEYFLNGNKIRPWKNYLDYMEREDSRPLLELLLGINTHINSDLPQCLGEINYEHRDDFTRINWILLESIIPVLSDIVLEHRDPESFALMAFQPLPLYGLNKIVKWRNQAWKNRKICKEKLKNSTEEKSNELVNIRHDKSIKGFLDKPRKVFQA